MKNSDDSRGALPVEQILSIENVAETFGISQWLLRYCEFRGSDQAPQPDRVDLGL